MAEMNSKMKTKHALIGAGVTAGALAAYPVIKAQRDKKKIIRGEIPNQGLVHQHIVKIGEKIIHPFRSVKMLSKEGRERKRAGYHQRKLENVSTKETIRARQRDNINYLRSGDVKALGPKRKE